MEVTDPSCLCNVDKGFGNMVSRTYLVAKAYTQRVFTANSFKANLAGNYKRSLILGIHVVDEARQNHWVKVKYEHLGEFSYRCSMIYHSVHSCSKSKRDNEGNEMESISSLGLWMHAEEVRCKAFSSSVYPPPLPLAPKKEQVASTYEPTPEELGYECLHHW
ncbi:hypothetical protein Tsubulata_028229 [Turnera subulata]|uniref:Zinc knuckle CX2CX4HX4C domain-containing protein n=1 Tax=Turnera subulata TaxID=218843 RepID=A0A9Q0GBX4_9ROSI|nr:hypothetical protein Tsubulata_028229 [Turnera subulata]